MLVKGATGSYAPDYLDTARIRHCYLTAPISSPSQRSQSDFGQQRVSSVLASERVRRLKEWYDQPYNYGTSGKNQKNSKDQEWYSTVISSGTSGHIRIDSKYTFHNFDFFIKLTQLRLSVLSDS